MRYFEDFAPGVTFHLGERTVSGAEMVAFAREYDPQSFHVDEAVAARTPYGGIIASGIFTTAVHMRMYVDAVLRDSACLGSPGVEEIRFPRPVRPGDTLRGTVRVLRAEISTFNRERGTVLLQSELRNQRDEIVLRLRSHVLFARRDRRARSPSERA